LELTLRSKSGKAVICRYSGDIIQTAEGSKLFSTAEDITERKQVEQALRESQALLFTAFNKSPLMKTLSDLSTGKYLEVNDSFCRVSEFSREEVIGKTAIELGWISKDERMRMMQKVQQAGWVSGIELALRSKNGKNIIGRYWGTVIHTTQGDKLFSASEDISERKQAENALRESEEKFKYLFDNSTVGKSLTLISGEMTANQALCDMFGYTQAEFQTKKWPEITHPDDIELTQREIEQLLSGEKNSTRFNKRYIHKNGSVVWADLNSSMRRDQDGKPLYLMTSVIDITERVQAEEEIQKLARHYQALIEKAPDGIVLLNEQGNFKFVSPSARKMFGYAVSDEIKGNPAEFTHPDDLPLVLSEMSRMFADQSYVPTLQYRFIDKSGNWIWVESTFSNLLADPSVESIVINFRDVSERRQAEEKMIVSETRYRRLFEAAKDGILILDADTGMILDANPFLLELLESSKEEIYGKELWELGFFKDIAANKSNFLELQENGYLRYEDLPLETARGHRLNVEFVSNVYQVNHHKVIQCNIRDITERKQAEKKVRQSEETLRNFIINSPDTIYVLDLENHTNKYLNSVEFCGYPKSVLESRTSIMFALHPQDMPIVQDNWKQMLRASDGEVTSCEYRLQRKDGVWEWIHQRMTIILRTVDGAPSQVLVTLSIITERKQIEEKIHQLNLDLEQRVEERTRELRDAQEQLVRHEKLAVLGQMASSVGHELRNPLAVITSAIYYLKMVQPDADAKIKEYLGVIDQEVRTSEKIITDLLDFSRIKSVDREAVSVFDLVRQTFERFPVPASVAVTIDIPTDLPRAYVDTRQMIQVLGNLTVNACQAMTGPSAVSKGGQLSLYSRLQNDMINIEVKDSGVGITPENMKKLFEPLFTTKAKGIGLGLAVSRKLIEANGGRIEVESEAGKGSSFSVFLPIDKELK
jgi:PAS domain S-box-containing protein